MPCSHTAKCPIEGFAPTSPVWLVLLRYEKRLGAQRHMTLCQSWTRFSVNSILISSVPSIFVWVFFSDRRKVLLVKKLLGLPGSSRAPSETQPDWHLPELWVRHLKPLATVPLIMTKRIRQGAPGVTVTTIRQQTKTQTKEHFYSPSWTQKWTGMCATLFPFKSHLEMHQWSLCHVILLLFWDKTVQRYAAVWCK